MREQPVEEQFGDESRLVAVLATEADDGPVSRLRDAETDDGNAEVAEFRLGSLSCKHDGPKGLLEAGAARDLQQRTSGLDSESRRLDLQ